jgi:ribosomal protein S18 acetylase RimI-like enzyme
VQAVTLPEASDYLIEPLGSHHNRAAFESGVEPLDRYFHTSAGQDAKKRVAAPFVLLDRTNGAVAGYYTLSATSINLGELPTAIAKKLPKYPVVPAILLGRLAVDKNYRGKRLGEMLLMDALNRCKRSEIAAMAIVVDALDDSACSFYEHYQFIRFPDYPNRLFLPITTIAKIFE